ncbi:MAG: HD-GYP domain-containing protein [Campylobacterales bacterium]|nr:HD-GYP domain-containing protein [Campylobacterales bacterium]
MNRSIKDLLQEKFTYLFVGTAIAITIVVGFSFRELSKISVENEANSIAEAVKAGLTSHMKAGIMDKKHYFLNEVATLYNVKSLKVIPSYEISQQYNQEKQTLDIEQKSVFLQKKSLYRFNAITVNPTVRALVPYMATSEGSLNCLSCHNSQKGEVLGVVDIVLDFEGYRNTTLIYMGTVIFILIGFLIYLTKSTSNLIDKKFLSPLKRIMKAGGNAYRKNRTLTRRNYDILELDELSEELYGFTKEILVRKEDLESTLNETAIIIGRIESYRSEETREHTRRVSEYAQLLAKKLGFSPQKVKDIGNAAALHDVGKLGIPREILHKRGPLTDEEFEIIKKHSEIGYDMLVHSSSGFLVTAAAIALQHHEKYDGTGYPFGLKGENISEEARIVAAIDVFDAVSNQRAYKDAWTFEESVDLIREGRGTHFDPQVVDVFLDSVDEIRTIKEKHS